MFSIKLYQSDFSQFIEDFLRKNPKDAGARAVLAKTWWESQVDDEQLQAFEQSKVKPKPYAYQPD